MNTAFTIITAAIVVGVIIMLISMVIMDSIRNKREEAKRIAYKEKEKYYNSFMPKRITFSDMRGFIYCEYAFGRWYLHYECINKDFEHYSKTMSFNDDGSVKENYGRLMTIYGFENPTHHQAFNDMKKQLRDIINIVCHN